MLSAVLFIASVMVSGAFCMIVKRKLLWRAQLLERDLQAVSDVMSKMADVQTSGFNKLSSRIDDLDERIMDLSVPSQDASLPLEKRHQVLALARQGVALEDIARRLKAPLGEAELILNLRKYLDRKNSRPAKMNKQVRPYV
jgi:hypothetical protein